MWARRLGEHDRPAILALLNQNPVENVFVSSHLHVLSPLVPGEIWGFPGFGKLKSLLFVGNNVVPVNVDDESRPALVQRVGPRLTSTSIVGPADQVLSLWRGLSIRWGASWREVRELRAHQPLMVLQAKPAVPADRRVRVLNEADLSSYMGAAIAMYTEELGVSPLESQPAMYLHFLRQLVQRGRAFGIVEDGQVIFKADVGAMSDRVAQIQGVWLHPAYRGQRIAAGAMAGVAEQVLTSHAVVSLYVNDFNAPAIATYRRTGFKQVGEFATILY